MSGKSRRETLFGGPLADKHTYDSTDVIWARHKSFRIALRKIACRENELSFNIRQKTISLAVYQRFSNPMVVLSVLWIREVVDG